MKFNFLITILCTVLLTVTSCRKDLDLQEKVADTPTASAQQTNESGSTEWVGNLSWTEVNRPNYSVYFANLNSDISAETADQGMVRVFKSSANGEVQALPFEETVNGQKRYWYYQITEGNILVSVDVYGAKVNPAGDAQFKPVIISKSEVSNYQAAGKSKSDLMKMSLDQFSESN